LRSKIRAIVGDDLPRSDADFVELDTALDDDVH
jgi:hypothetical protein